METRHHPKNRTDIWFAEPSPRVMTCSTPPARSSPVWISPFCIRHNGFRSDLKQGMVFSLSDHKGVCRAILYSYQAVSIALWHNHACIIVFLRAFLTAEKRLSKQPCPSINLYQKTRGRRNEFLWNVPWYTPGITRGPFISVFQTKIWFYVTLSVYPNILNTCELITLGKVYKLWSSLTCNFQGSAAASWDGTPAVSLRKMSNKYGLLGHKIIREVITHLKVVSLFQIPEHTLVRV